MIKIKTKNTNYHNDIQSVNNNNDDDIKRLKSQSQWRRKINEKENGTHFSYNSFFFYSFMIFFYMIPVFF